MIAPKNRVADRVRLTEMPTIPSTPTCAIGRSRSALCRKTATPVAATANAAKRTATMLALRVILSRPGKERNVTDALRTRAAFGTNSEKEGLKPLHGKQCLTIKQVHAPMMKSGDGPRRRPDSSSVERPLRRARSRKK